MPASEQKQIRPDEGQSLAEIYENISLILTILIRYLIHENRTVRH
jgi:hypothetical protein